MSELPKGWESLSLKEIVKEGGGTIDPRSFPDEEFDLFSIPSFSDGVPEAVVGTNIGSTKQFVQQGDVLLSKIVPHIRRVWVVPRTDGRRQIASGEWIVYRSSYVEPNFIRLALSESSFRTKFLGTVSGVGGSLMRASPKRVAEFVIPLPPLAEQTRIVAKVDALNTKSARARAELVRIETLASRYKQAMLGKSFSGDGLDKSIPNALPLSELVTLRTGPFGSALHKSDYIDGGVPLVNPMHIVKGKIEVDPMTSVTAEKAEQLEEFRLKAGDVVLARRGEMGRAAVVSEGEDGYLCGTGSMIVRPGPLLSPIYLQRYLSSPGVVSALVSAAVGTTMVNLNQSILLNQTIPLPSLEEQHDIVRRIESAFAKIDQLARQAKRALELVGKLDEAILAKALRGELVPQDENDEPAGSLLERVKQAREGQPTKTKRTGPPRQGKLPDMARTIVETLVEAKGWLSAQELFERCGVRDGSSTEEVELLYRQLLDLEREDKIEIEEVADPTSGAKQGDRVRLRK